jgi:ribosomal protein L7/L12
MDIRALNPFQINHNEFAAIVRYVVANKSKIEAMKELRVLFNLGLRDCKRLVEAALSDPLLLELQAIANEGNIANQARPH